ncbi:MAG: threonine synthase [Thermoplasmata archaeon]
MESFLTGLECRACCTVVPADRLIGACPTCGQALLATYDLARAREHVSLDRWRSRPGTLWRYFELLPVSAPDEVVSLGEGFTPLVELGTVPEAPTLKVMLKDDGQMPTGSFKARGMSVAVSRARELGAKTLYAPSAGNAGVALSAYCARGGLRARVYIPDRAPASYRRRCEEYGAEVVEVEGTISDAGRTAREREGRAGGFDMSTLREPYRVEGKKTMALEIFEQLHHGGPPDAIVYPAGGGTGIVGMHKGFEELKALGLLDRSPRLIAVQAAECAPIVRALRNNAADIEPWKAPSTAASGLLVPAPFSGPRILEAIRRSGGTAEVVTDEEMALAVRQLALRHGISASLEGAAPYAALPKLRSSGAIRDDERVLLYNTANGLTGAN